MTTIPLPKTDEEVKKFFDPGSFVVFLKTITDSRERMLFHCIISNSTLPQKYALLTALMHPSLIQLTAAAFSHNSVAVVNVRTDIQSINQFITEQLLYEQEVQRGNRYKPDVLEKMNQIDDITEKLDLIENSYFPSPLLFSKDQTASILSTLGDVVFYCIQYGETTSFERAVCSIVQIHTAEAREELERILRDNSLAVPMLTQDTKEKYRLFLKKALAEF